MNKSMVSFEIPFIWIDIKLAVQQAVEEAKSRPPRRGEPHPQPNSSLMGCPNSNNNYYHLYISFLEPWPSSSQFRSAGLASLHFYSFSIDEDLFFFKKKWS